MTLTASSLAIAIACPGSQSLPQSDYSSAHAAAGTERHAAKEAAVNEHDLSVLPEDVQALVDFGDIFVTELAVSYDVATGEACNLGQNVGRDYAGHLARTGQRPLAATEIPGTMDLLILSEQSRRAIVVDYKGHREADHSAQLGLYAIAVAKLYGLDEVTTVVVGEAQRPKITTLDMFDLSSFDTQLRAMWKAIDGARDMPHEFLYVGPHCTYCKAFTHCPKQNALAMELSSGAADNRVELMLPLADDQGAADAYDFAVRVKLLLTRLNAAIYARAAQRPIPLNNGKLLGLVSKLGNRQLDGDKAHAVILAKHGQTIADAAVTREATQSSIEKALKPVAPRGNLAALKTAVLRDLEAVGGVTRKTTTTIEEYSPGDARAVAASGDLVEQLEASVAAPAEPDLRATARMG